MGVVGRCSTFLTVSYLRVSNAKTGFKKQTVDGNKGVQHLARDLHTKWRPLLPRAASPSNSLLHDLPRMPVEALAGACSLFLAAFGH